VCVCVCRQSHMTQMDQFCYRCVCVCPEDTGPLGLRFKKPGSDVYSRQDIQTSRYLCVSDPLDGQTLELLSAFYLSVIL